MRIATVFLLLGLAFGLPAQTATTITYQGQLQDSGGPVNDTLGMEFRLFDSLEGGNQVGSEIVFSAVEVTDGLFEVELDFGEVFGGSPLYLEVEVAGNILQPRQLVTATPTAISALNVSSSGLAELDDRYWKQGGNAGIDPTADYLGTTDNSAFVLRVDNAQSLRLIPSVDAESGFSPNLIGGSSANSVDDSTDDNPPVVGAVIAGGGLSTTENTVGEDFATVGGGEANTASGLWATVGGGVINTASGSSSTVSGGSNNSADGADSATVGGGTLNEASGSWSTVPGGANNQARGDYSFAAGRLARAKDAGTFVWADSENAIFESTQPDQFLIEATGGVGVGTNAPRNQLDVRRGVTGNAITANHVAVFENTGGISGDVLALKASVVDPGNAVNFITFKDADGNNIGAVEGDGSGGVTYNSESGDFAEYLPRRDRDEAIAPAEVVGLHAGGISKHTEGADRAMVVSSRPIVKGNLPEDDESRYEVVAFMGQVPVKVRGPVAAGDLLVASGDNDGVAIAADAAEVAGRGLHQVLGRALETSDHSGTGKVAALVGLPQGGVTDVVVAGLNERITALEAENARLRELAERNARLAEDNAELEERLAALEAMLLEDRQVAEEQ